ncbi:hypothetical protein BGW42_008283, partial [Actinomortierella wolfii]
QRRSRSIQSPTPYTRRQRNSASSTTPSKEAVQADPAADNAGESSSSATSSSADLAVPTSSFTFEPPPMQPPSIKATAAPIVTEHAQTASSSTVASTSGSSSIPNPDTSQASSTAPVAPRPKIKRTPVKMPTCPPISNEDGTPNVTFIPPWHPATDSSVRKLYLQQLSFHFNSLIDRHREAWSNLMFYSSNVTADNSYLKSAQFNVERLHAEMQVVDAAFRFHLQHFEAPKDPYREHYRSVMQAYDARMNEYAQILTQYHEAWLKRFQPPEPPQK